MNKKIKIGIIGYGSFGKFIYSTLSSTEYVEVIAIADKQNKSGLPMQVDFFQDWRIMLSIDELDAVLISTPPSSHLEISLAALWAGKHIMVEKPLAISSEAAQQIKQTAQKTNRVVMVDFLQRFNPILEALHELYSNNSFGKLERFSVENYAQDEALSPHHWFWDQNISGGILIEHAVHFIDLVHWFAPSDIVKISGFKDARNSDQVDRVNANIQYANGVIASHSHSFTRPNVFERTDMRFIFNTAQFSLNGWIPQSGSFTLLANDELVTKLNVLPNLEITKKFNIEKAPIRGHEFDLNYLLEGTFESSYSKEELYTMAIEKIFYDFYQKITNRSHQVRVSIEDGIKAVYAAERANV
jgi:predicted dehydrogenase